MKVELIQENKADAIIIFNFKDAETDMFKRMDMRLGGILSKLKQEKEFEGKRQEVKTIYTEHHMFRAVICVGLGDQRGFGIPRLLEAVEYSVRNALKQGFSSVGVLSESFPGLSREDTCARITEAATVTARVYDTYFVEKKKELRTIKTLSIVAPKTMEKPFKEALLVAEAVNTARDLQDMIAADLYPETFAKAARELAKNRGLKCTVWNEKELAKQKYNAILAVGQGSARPPRLVTLEYKPKGAKKTICLVGKGITFDSGGYNLKPGAAMYDMKDDMSGAAVVYGVMDAIAKLKLKVNVIGILGCAENMIGANAYRPSDVITTAEGITVENGNTDAEGRLVLADALHHAKKFKPDYIMDFATLTGACVVALGSVCSAVIGTDQAFIDTLRKSGDTVGERIWQLPLFEQFEDDLESKIADIKSIGHKGEAGTITAAYFLKQFVGDHKWAHLDIAGTAFVNRPRFMTESGGTGFGIRLVVDWLRSLQ